MKKKFIIFSCFVLLFSACDDGSQYNNPSVEQESESESESGSGSESGGGNEGGGSTNKSGFAGGTGTSYNPYQISSPEHMQQMKKYPNSHFILISDINMSSIKWFPFELGGSFNGQNHTISNLTLNTNLTSDNIGLFSVVKKNVSVRNIIINGITINTPNRNNIGAIAGKLEEGGTINNCQVIFKSNSYIIGNQCVGGLVGYFTQVSSSGSDNLSNCEVKSNSSNAVISGNAIVGGAVGYAFVMGVSAIRVSASIQTADGYCGGIIGSANSQNSNCTVISKCSFSGGIYALNNGAMGIGGIAGCGEKATTGPRNCTINGCKANVHIEATNATKVAGIAGGSGAITGCYSIGEIIGCNGAAGIHGNYSSGTGYVEHSYTLMNLPIRSGSYYSNSESFSIRDLVTEFASPIDIAQIMYATNSQNASYWNYNNTFNWNGTISGNNVSARCPRLEWE